MKKVAVIIPCYNVGPHIEKVVYSIPDWVNFIVAVDDCGTDDTPAILEKLEKIISHLHVLRHEQNGGVGKAMLTGYNFALDQGADIMVKMDGDGQMDPDELQRLVKPLSEGFADFTKGNRFRDLRALKTMPLGRRLGNLGLSFMIKAASGYWKVFDPTNGYTAITASTYRQLEHRRIDHRYFFESSILTELYLTRAIIQDIPMKAIYGEEVSNLSKRRVLMEFPPKLLVRFIRRLILMYYLYDFNIGSIYLSVGTTLLAIGSYMGFTNFFFYFKNQIAAPTRTVVIPTLFIILGTQLLLSAIQFDMDNEPKYRTKA